MQMNRWSHVTTSNDVKKICARLKPQFQKILEETLYFYYSLINKNTCAYKTNSIIFARFDTVPAFLKAE